MGWLTEWFNWMMTVLAGLLQAVLDWVVEFGAGVLEGFLDGIGWTAIDSFLSDARAYLAPVFTVAADVDWFVGWIGGVQILSSAYIIGVGIRIGRTGKAFVPTMGD